MRTIRSLLWIGTGQGLCESGMTEAPELDVTWVRSLTEAALLPRVQFDGVLFEAGEPSDVQEAVDMTSRQGQSSILLVCLPKCYEADTEKMLEMGAAAILFVDPMQSGLGFVSEIARTLDILHENIPPRCSLGRPAASPNTGPAPAPDSGTHPNSANAAVIPFVAPTDAWQPTEAETAPEAESPLDETTPRVVSVSPAMNDVAELVDLAASSPSTVLLTGETGVGKEVIARQLHARSCREEEPFIAINCAAFPESLLESELFGHLKGAFTGADRAKTGLFEAAGKGTLFLDEIAEMELPLQAKLLRVLQEREIRPVGGTTSIPVHCRIVAATTAFSLTKSRAVIFEKTFSID